MGARPYEKTIGTSDWAIYRRSACCGVAKSSNIPILRAIRLLDFVKVITFHTASVVRRPPVRHQIRAEVVLASG